jgi:galactose mutarotase-like enzyme
MELTLTDAESGAIATIEPERGGIVTRFDVGARRILYMDVETLRDATKNVRGGVPVLFPTPGKLADDAWAYAGHHGSMKQHGFARNLVWQVARSSTTEVALTLVANDATRAQFPWDFIVEQTFTLRGTTLRLEQRVTNRAAEAMPFGFGFHPYFAVADADKRRTTIATAATRAFDNVTKQTIELRGIDLTAKEVDLHLLDHGSTSSELVSPAGAVALRCSPEYTHWVVWTLTGRDFVCVEPWTCPGNALNTGDRLIVLAPMESRSLWFEIDATR